MAKTIVKEGGLAPQFSLASDTGESFDLKQFRGKKVILFFYPKDMTSGCTTEACDFRDSFASFKKKGVIVLGVSKDSVASHQKFRDKNDLPFPLLSDPEGKVCEAYGVWKEKSMYGRKYMGIERTTFLIDEKGKITKIFEKVKVSGHVAELLCLV